MKTYIEILMETIGEDLMEKKKKRRRRRRARVSARPGFYGWIGYPGGGVDGDGGGGGE